MSKTNENATMAKPTENNFSLEKVKLVNNGGICAHYDVTEVVGGMSYTNHYVVDNGMDVHPDLARLFVDLRPIVARVFNINSFLSFIEDSANKIPAKIQEQARGFAGELLNNIDIREIKNGSLGNFENPFRNPQYILLNLAIGGRHGGTLQHDAFPMRYEVDYVRVWQQK